MDGSKPHLEPARRPTRLSWSWSIAKSRSGLRTLVVLTVGLCATVGIGGGCRSRAYQRVYTEKMAGEIRRLEDQVYAVEYENEVLRQQLARQEAARSKSTGDKLPPRPLTGDRIQDDRLPSGKPSQPVHQPPNRSNPRQDADLEDLDNLEIDLGQQMDPTGPGRAADPPSVDPIDVPPINPIPPRESESVPPLIELGDPLPPSSNNGTKPNPPGQIQIPGEVKKFYPGPPPIAASIEIHEGLSGFSLGERVDAGVYLVFTVRDPESTPFHASHPTSVVLLDPSRKGQDARLGRWDFSASEIKAAFREYPLPSYHLKLEWKDKQPAGTELAAFVRLTVDPETKLEADSILSSTSGQDRGPASAKTWEPNSFGAEMASPHFDREIIWR